MPIYEFYCKKCNTIYNFFSKTVNTEKVPLCPECGHVKLERQLSVFASISSGKDDEGDSGMEGFDEARMEKAISMLAGEAEKINEDDPRQAAELMRKISDAAGIKMGPSMEEAISRMEQGEDPSKVEAEMGDLLEGEAPIFADVKRRVKGAMQRPSVNETLYDL